MVDIQIDLRPRHPGIEHSVSLQHAASRRRQIYTRFQSGEGHMLQRGFDPANAYPEMPGLPSTPLRVTPPPRGEDALPARRWLANTSHTGLPACALTDAQPATL